MKRTLITPDLSQYPSVFHSLLRGARIYDSSCSPQARVILIDRDGGYFLKSSAPQSLKREAELDRFFHPRGMGAEVVEYQTLEGRDWLLTRRVGGEDCTYRQYLEDPRRLCDTLAELLRALHETSVEGCPVQDRMKDYFKTVEDNYREGLFDSSYASDFWKDPSAEELYAFVQAHKGELASDTLLHGDYCLPNIMLDGWHFSGFIDLGNGGVGDRHVDLYWGAWTLRFNLGTDHYCQRFFDAYGKELVDADKLCVVAASECFG